VWRRIGYRLDRLRTRGWRQWRTVTAEPWVHVGARGATTTVCDRTAPATSRGTVRSRARKMPAHFAVRCNEKCESLLPKEADA
jgi:hypothetical protein